MEAIVVSEDITDDFEPAKEMAVGSYHNTKPSPGMHWAHIGRSIFAMVGLDSVSYLIR